MLIVTYIHIYTYYMQYVYLVPDFAAWQTEFLLPTIRVRTNEDERIRRRDEKQHTRAQIAISPPFVFHFTWNKRRETRTAIMTSPRNGKIHLSVVAGICATIGSLFGKLSGSVSVDSTSMTFIFLKLFLLLLMVTSNTAGCTFFVKSLQGSGSSLPATVASAATNYFCSALIGSLVFGESTSLMWWTGTTLVLCGLLLICYSPTNIKITQDSDEKSKQQ